MKNKKENVKRMLAIYDAIAGMCSEREDPFRRFYKGGTDALLSDMEKVLSDCGVEIEEPEYCVASYYHDGKEKWGICSDPDNPRESWVLTGFPSSEEACASLMDKSLFPEFSGIPRVLGMADPGRGQVWHDCAGDAVRKGRK